MDVWFGLGVVRRATGLLLVLAATLLTASPSPAVAQQLRGRVYDFSTGTGIEGAEVAILRASVIVRKTRTDATGLFALALPDSGGISVLVRRVGYFGAVVATTTTASRDTLELLVRLQPLAQLLAEMRVEAAKAGLDFTKGFEQRRRRGLGVFLGPEDIRKRGPQRATELVYGIPGFEVAVDPSQEGLQIQRILSTRASAFGGCEPALFVDGLQVDAEELYRGYSSSTIEAIEAYRASEAPARFSTGRSLCGVILFWTMSRVGRSP